MKQTRTILMATMGLDIGGAETHIVELSRELKRRGYDVIVASNGGVYQAELEAAGIRTVCYVFPHGEKSKNLLEYAKILKRKIRDYFKTLSP